MIQEQLLSQYTYSGKRTTIMKAMNILAECNHSHAPISSTSANANDSNTPSVDIAADVVAAEDESVVGKEQQRQ